MVTRNETRKIFVGDVQIGGQDKVVIQSMTNTKTKDVKSTVEQILKLEEAGCEIIRVACLDEEDAKAIKEIKNKIQTGSGSGCCRNRQNKNKSREYWKRR